MNKILLIATILISFNILNAYGQFLRRVPVFRYFNGRDHFYTTNANEIGTIIVGAYGNYGYRYEGVGFRVHNVRTFPLVPFYRYFNGVDHFYTVDPNEIGVTSVGAVGRYNYRYEGILGYCYRFRAVDTVPLYRYFNGVDHFYTTNPYEIGTTTVGVVGRFNYRFESIACYVFRA